ncbi:MAG: peptidoglycan-binding domain-containing protein [Pseudomonadota bacterium]
MLVAVVASVTTASAEDTEGRYAVKGSGQMPCAEFTRALADRTEAATQALSWLAGYLTAINASEDATFDIVSWQSEGMIAQALDARCKANPDEPLAKAVEAMVAIMRPDRIAIQETPIEVKLGQRKRVLYPSVITRMQSALKTAGADVDVNGEFDEATERALRDFQRNASLAATGFPDSITLFRLLNTN